jgi:hypothetical protein
MACGSPKSRIFTHFWPFVVSFRSFGGCLRAVPAQPDFHPYALDFASL